jgi:hypothetical protein
MGIHKHNGHIFHRDCVMAFIENSKDRKKGIPIIFILIIITKINDSLSEQQENRFFFAAPELAYQIVRQ